MYFEVVVVDRVAQVVLEAEPVSNARVQIGIEELVPCFAMRLGVIHRGVRVAHDLVRACVLGMAECDADAGRR
jgi:hypothetical protein